MAFSRHLTALAVGILLATTASTAVLHISPTGSDAADGSEAAPLATLDAARLAVRRLPRPLTEPVSVLIHDGSYRVAAPIRFDKADSGTVEAPVTYRAAPGAKPIFSGGRLVTLKKVPSMELARIPESAREHVRVVDLAEQGVNDFGTLKVRGFGAGGTAALELYCDGVRMPTASYPNSGWLTIKAVPTGGKGDQFTMADERMTAWQEAPDAWLYGYWHYDWADSYLPVKTMDAATGTVTVAAKSGYDFKKGARFRLLNVAAELDMPGEWYLDRTIGRLYFWPPDGQAEVLVSVLEKPIIEFNDCTDVQLADLTFEGGRGAAITIRNSSRIICDGCTVRCFGTSGIGVSGGTANRIAYCTVHEIGGTAISVTGGSRQTLTPGGHEVSNCHIYDFGRTMRTYTPAVSLGGVGQRAVHNHIHNGSHMAIGFGGNDHLLAFNDVHHVLLDTDDAGAFYIGRDWTQRGHQILWNHMHQCGLPYAPVEAGAPPGLAPKAQHLHGVSLLYFDDCASGIVARHNILRDTYRAVLIGGGRDNEVTDNVVIGCQIGVWVDARGIGWAKGHAEPGGGWHMQDKLTAMRYQEPPFSIAYPKLAVMMDNQPYAPIGTVVTGNLFSGVKEMIKLQTAKAEMLTLADNTTAEVQPQTLPPEPTELLKALNRPLPPEPIGIIPR